MIFDNITSNPLSLTSWTRQETLNSGNKLCIYKRTCFWYIGTQRISGERWNEKKKILWYLTSLLEIQFELITRRECKRIWIIDYTSKSTLAKNCFLPRVFLSWCIVGMLVWAISISICQARQCINDWHPYVDFHCKIIIEKV